MGGKRSTVDDLIQNTRLPFTRRVMRYPLLKKFKVPHIKPYDGTDDPVERLKSYRAHINLHTTLDEIACRAFPVTLEGNTQEWFGGLPPDSVDDFDGMTKTFLMQFLVGRKRKRTLQYLVTLRRGDTKSLKDYLHRFNQESLTVEDVPKNFILAAILNELSPKGSLVPELTKRTPTTFEEFMDKAEEFTSYEEMMKAYAKRGRSPRTLARRMSPRKAKELRANGRV